MSADVSCSFMAAAAVPIDQFAGLQLFSAQRSARCSFGLPPNDIVGYEGCSETGCLCGGSGITAEKRLKGYGAEARCSSAG